MENTDPKKTGIFYNGLPAILLFCFCLTGMAATLFSLTSPVYAQTRTDGIAAVVGDDAISMSDVTARVRLVMASSGLPDNQDIRERVTQQVLNTLIDEQLKLQEAARLEIKISEKDIEDGFAAVAAQNNFSADQFKEILAKENISHRTIYNQIKSQIAWARIIQSRLRTQVEVSERDVRDMYDRLQENIGKTEYLAAEIFLPVEKPSEEDNVKKLAERLTKQLLQGEVPFTRLAAQFSQSASAAKGGDMGWIQEGQLPEKLDKQLARMEEGDLSRPVRSLTGYHILYLRKKRTIAEENIPSFEEIGSQIGMEQLERLQRRYLLDLKSEAFIEMRV